VAFINARASLIFCLLLAVLFALPYNGNNIRTTQRDEADAKG
jgi:hypothetical protein